MAYNIFVSDNLDVKGFISKEAILQHTTQEAIFSLVLGYEPVEYTYVTSPIRKDSKPSCWFEYHSNGVLYFLDFSGRRTHSDCFNLVQDYFKIANFYLTLEFVYDKLLRGKDIKAETAVSATRVHVDKKEVRILAETRQWNHLDRQYWSKFNISKENLIEDKVFPVHRYHTLNTKKGSFTTNVFGLCYAYTEFNEGRKKLYFPNRQHGSRFLSTCQRNDIGGEMSSTVKQGKQLIIQKSYKDYRVVKNCGKHTRWFQSEGTKPEPEVIHKVCGGFDDIIVFYDNDRAGIDAAVSTTHYINSILPGRARSLWIPERMRDKGIKDAADIVSNMGADALQEFLNYRT